MPKSRHFSTAVVTATRCLFSASVEAPSSGPSPRCNQAFTVRAFIIVSAVVKVLEMTTTSVRVGSRPSSQRIQSIGSTFAKKRIRRPAAAAAAVLSVLSASRTYSPPRYEPPMPIYTTSVKRSPVAPTQDPPRTLSAKSRTSARTRRTSRTVARRCSGVVASASQAQRSK